MKKILIVGIVGSGKTTFSHELSSILRYPIFELDQVAHNSNVEGRPKRSPEEQMKMIHDIDVENSNWIFEGVFRESHRDIYNMADAIIYLNLPLWIRKKRIILRFIKQQLGIESCHYKSDIRMLKFMFKWTKDFEDKREAYEDFLRGFSNKVVELKNPREVRRFVRTLRLSEVSANHDV